MTPPLQDRTGRTFESLRVSVTDRCNFRCRYCMPSEEMTWFPRGGILAFEEIDRLVGILAGLGLRRVRLTGGEPLVRRDLPRLVRMLAARKASGAIRDLCLTTNGVLLAGLAGELRRAGLDRVTVSLDTLDAARFREMTRRDEFDRVLGGIAEARRVFGTVKINVVVVAGWNEGEAADFASFARETGDHVRFIEYMPLDGGAGWGMDRVVPGRVLRERIEAVHALLPVLPEHPAQPSRDFRFADGAPGGVGFINPVTEPFCRSCDRMRLTADGKLKNCMFDREEVDLMEVLRAGGTDAAIERRIRTCAEAKGPGGLLSIREAHEYEGLRNMSRLGG